MPASRLFFTLAFSSTPTRFMQTDLISALQVSYSSSSIIKQLVPIASPVTSLDVKSYLFLLISVCLPPDPSSLPVSGLLPQASSFTPSALTCLFVWLVPKLLLPRSSYSWCFQRLSGAMARGLQARTTEWH